MKNKIIYLTTGKETYHIEALYSISSAINLLNNQTDEIELVVHTDQVSLYQKLPIAIKEISPSLLRNWKGPFDYIFRAKHACLLSELNDADQCILIDSDTFFYRSPLTLFERVSNNSLLCNALQATFGENKEDYTYKCLAHLLQPAGLAPDEMRRLNSGVIGLTKSNKIILEKSIQLMDEFYAKAPLSYNIEEFALAVSANTEKLKVNTCTDIIRHYWSRKNIIRAKVTEWHKRHKDTPLSADSFRDMQLINATPPKPPTLARMANKAKTMLVPKEHRQFAIELLNGCYNYSNEFEKACKFAWWETALKNALEKSNLDKEKAFKLLQTLPLKLAVGQENCTEITNYLERVD